MGIGAQIRLLALVLILATAGAVGMIMYWGSNELVDDLRRDSLRRLVRTEGERLQGWFTLLRRDVELISLIPAVRLYGRDQQAAELDRIAEVMLQLAQRRPYYTQIRLIAADGGREVVRVNRIGERIERVPESALQLKGDRPYVREALRQQPGNYYLSPIELNREHGQLERPFRPTVRGVVSVPDATGGIWGLVVVNVDFAPLMDYLYKDRHDTRRYRLANADGEYLMHENDVRTFAFETGGHARLTDDAPTTASLFADNAWPGATVDLAWPDDDDALAHFQRIEVDPRGREHALVLGVVSAPGALADNTSALTRRAMVATGGMLALAIGLGYAASWVVVQPIRRIGAAARAFGAGQPPGPLPTSRNDEIGDLARTFDAVTHDLQRKQDELSEANQRMEIALRDLDHFAHVAAHDLREPVRRIAALSDLLIQREGARLSEEGQHQAARLRLAASAVLQQITAFRDLVDLRQGDMVRSPVNTSVVVHTLADEFTGDFKARGFTLDIGDLPTVQAYEHLVPALFRKLFQHALDHARAAQMQITVAAARNDGGYWRFRFRNTIITTESPAGTAAGVSFNAFAVDALSADLGLAIARRIVERHADRLEIRSGDDHVEFSFGFGSHAEVS